MKKIIMLVPAMFLLLVSLNAIGLLRVSLQLSHCTSYPREATRSFRRGCSGLSILPPRRAGYCSSRCMRQGAFSRAFQQAPGFSRMALSYKDDISFGSGLISMQYAPLSLAILGKPAAGQTTPDVPILIKRSHRLTIKLASLMTS